MAALSQLLLGLVLCAAGPAESLQLSARCTHTGGAVVVVATATNIAEEVLEFCGLWRAKLEFVPNEEGRKLIAAYNESMAEQRAKAEASGNLYFREDTPRFAPTYIDVSGVAVDGIAQRPVVRLMPGEILVRTIEFQLDKSWYEQWPGSLEVQCTLDLCGGLADDQLSVPHNGLGGGVVVSIPLP